LTDLLNKKVDCSVLVRTGILLPNTAEEGKVVSDTGSIVSEVSDLAACFSHK
jgi:hypothetical protein